MEYFEILWNNALGELEKTVSSISYATFIETITPIDIQNNKLILMTPSEHFANAVNGRLGDKVRDALARTNSGITDFSLFIGDKKEKYFEEKNERLSSDLPAHRPQADVRQLRGGRLQPLYLRGGEGRCGSARRGV